MRVTVVMATHNGMAHLPTQLQSIAAQVRLPDMLHIHDDGSTDDTFSIVERFAASAPFEVRTTRRETADGPTRAFEAALATVEDRSGLVALCDQDDTMHPQKLARLEAAFRSRAGLTLVSSDAALMDVEGRTLSGSLWERRGINRRRRRQVEADAVGTLANHYLLTGATMAIRAAQLDTILPLPDELAPANSDLEVLHDAWIGLVCAAAGPIALLGEPLMTYRVHPRQRVGPPPDSRWRRRLPSPLRWQLTGARTRRDVEHRQLMARTLEEAADRLTGSGDLNAAQRHLVVRSSITERRHRRFNPVWEEWRRGGYARFSSGTLSALDDLLRRPARPVR